MADLLEYSWVFCTGFECLSLYIDLYVLFVISGTLIIAMCCVSI